MAKQTGPVFIEGTLHGVTFYKRNGVWLARTKTSLNKKRVSTDPAFAGSRRASAAFGNAAKLAKKIYWQLPAGKRGRGVIGKLTGAINNMQVNGQSPAVIESQLLKQFGK